MYKTILDVGFLLAAIAFIIGLRNLSTPATARKGNIIAGVGMIVAIIIALIYPLESTTGTVNYLWIGGGIIIGSIIGITAAKRVQMTAMPQMVSIFNGLGGACAVILAVLEMIAADPSNKIGIAVSVFTLLVGSISFTGSILAYLKLDGKVKDKNVILPGHTYINLVLLIVSLVLAVMYIINPGEGLLIALIALSLIYGFSFVAPIGGADMPVVISLLNSLTGISAATAGFIYNNQIMIIGGILVGASGTILTVLMCDAMNRSLLNVIIGGFGSAGKSSAGSDDGKVAKEISSYDAAVMMNYASSVVFVPGYGLAVAQAQKICKELDEQLSKNGVDVNYAIHPVAGRMPGHMNVLLAEADVPYSKLKDLDEANDILPNADVVVIVGANDVVNPSALDDPGSPVYGMPVLKVWEAKNVIVLKRSMSPGYAGIQNPLFFYDNNYMFFGDAKDSLGRLVSEVKSLN